MEKSRQPLKQAVQQLGVVGGSLFRRFPLFFFIFLFSFGFACYSIFSNREGMQIFLCILISITSFIIYMKSQSYGETILSFMLGILTIFTINWDENNAHIFIIAFILFNAIIFIGMSVKLSAQIETILTQAASFIDINNHQVVYKELQKILNKDTRFKQLGAINKAESIRFMAFLGVPINEMEFGLNAIEGIKTINQVELKQALNFFRSIYFFKYRTNRYNSLEGILDIFVNQINSIPLTPDEFLIIFDKTKKNVISHKMTLEEYFSELRILLLSGADEDEIIKSLNSDVSKTTPNIV